MSTTRHLINRQRRLAAASAATSERTVRPAAEPAAGRTSGRTTDRTRTRDRAGEPAADTAPSLARARRAALAKAAAADAVPDEPRERRLRRPGGFPSALGLLALLTVLLGAFAALAAGKVSALHDDSAASNTALTDNARTSEVKGVIAQDVNAVFSYDYADTARTDKAARKVLTGKAVQQYASMIAQVKQQAPKQKLVLTTTVTDTGVEMIDGDRARVLVYADQSNTSTAKGASTGSTYAAAMFAVDAVHQDGTWKIASIDTFG